MTSDNVHVVYSRFLQIKVRDTENVGYVYVFVMKSKMFANSILLKFSMYFETEFYVF